MNCGDQTNEVKMRPSQLNLSLKGLRHGDLADFWPKLSWKLEVATTSKGRYNLHSP